MAIATSFCQALLTMTKAGKPELFLPVELCWINLQPGKGGGEGGGSCAAGWHHMPSQRV